MSDAPGPPLGGPAAKSIHRVKVEGVDLLRQRSMGVTQLDRSVPVPAVRSTWDRDTRLLDVQDDPRRGPSRKT